MAAARKFVAQAATMNCIFLSLFFIFVNAEGKSKADDVAEADKWKKKDVRDYSDVDVERLFEQWEDADEDKLEPDELPEWKRPQPKVDLSKLDPNNPEAMLQATKKGKTLMMFASVSGDPTEKETEEITKLWQTSLFNGNMETQRYVVGSNRVLFMLKDGAYAWVVKEFLINQERCEVVTIEGQDYPGKGSPNFKATAKEEPPKTKTKTNKKKKAVPVENSKTERKEKSKKEKVEL